MSFDYDWCSHAKQVTMVTCTTDGWQHYATHERRPECVLPERR